MATYFSAETFHFFSDTVSGIVCLSFYVLIGFGLLFIPTKAPNHAMQLTASRAAIDVQRVCHPPFGCVARFTGLAVADLVSR
jgi:hypothetical protein